MIGRSKKKAKRRVGQVATVLLAALVGFVAAVITTAVGSAGPPYPIQAVTSQGPRVTSPSDGSEVPVVSLSSDFVEVTGRKCLDEETRVRGQVGWRSIVPGGFAYVVPDNSNGVPAVRLAGCSPFKTFENQIPEPVVEWATRVIERGGTPEVVIGGCETPVRDNDSEGEELCWTTERFVLVR